MEGVTIRGIVFKDKHETNGEVWYSYLLSTASKDKEGNYVYTKYPIRFVGGIKEPEDRQKITLKSAWPKPFKYKGIDDYPGWFCNDYEESEPKGEIHGFSALADDDIPF